MAAAKKSWMPFWIVMMLYVPVRLFFVAEPGPVTYIVALLDPVTVIVAVVVGLIVRAIVPAKVAA